VKAIPLCLAIPIAAALVAAFAWLTNSPERDRASLALDGFGYRRLFFAQLVCALPLAYVVAAFVRTKIQSSIHEIRWAIAFAIVGCLACLALPIIGAILIDAFQSLDAGNSFRAPVRCGLLAGIVAAMAIAVTDVDTNRTPMSIRAFAATLAFGTIPPIAYTDRLEVIHTARAEQLLSTGRFQAAKIELSALEEIGSRKTFDKKPIAKVLPALQARIDQLQTRVEQWKQQSGVDDLTFAFHYIQLDRFDVAEAILLKKADDIQCLGLLASLYRDRRRWNDMLEVDRKSLALDSSNRSRDVRASIGEALENLDRYREAEQTYRQAIEEIPSHTAFFLRKLGMMYAEMGRHDLAIVELERAMSLDPNLRDQIQPIVKSLKTTTLSCFSKR
jgi:tetratricopeptide (TPR) repeat protein